jgi:hypothetical protein
MKLISHRGNTNGPRPALENSPAYLLKAIDSGFDVEVDVWVKSGEIYLGHDGPQYLVGSDFIDLIKENAWFHCKNTEALNFFVTKDKNLYQYFWHEKDQYTLVSNGVIWAYPGTELSKNAIIVDLNEDYSYDPDEIFGICFDYI